MFRLAAILICVLMPCLASAQTVPVRSGEHADFTRLTFDLPRRMEWTIGQDENRAVLKFPGENLVPDTSAVFDRLSQGRVRAVAAGPELGEITIALGCACEIRAFWHDRAMLVVDLSGEVDTAKAPSGIAAPFAPRPSELVVQNESGLTLQPIPLPARSTSASAELAAPYLAARGRTGEMAVPARQADVMTLRTSRNRLARHFGRAASQGLLSLNSPLSNRAALRPDVPNDTTPSPARARNDLLATETVPGRNINLRAQSSIDRDFLARLAGSSAAFDAHGCLDPALADLTSWAGGTPFWVQVGALRARLFQEFDRVDETAAMELARLYVHFGFGAEARQVLSMAVDRSLAYRILVELADIMEDGHAAPASILAGHANCDTPMALWAVLARETLRPDIRIEIDAVLRAFSALPKHQRAYLGPVLSRRFLAAGLTGESDRVLRILARAEDTLSPASELVKAEMELAAGETIAADDRLEAVVAANSEPSAEALARRIDGKLANGEVISYDLAQLAGAFAHEFADGPLATPLRRAHILALAASGALDESFAELRSSGFEVPGLRTEMAAIVAERAEPIDFLRHVLAGRLGPPEAVAPATAVKVATRLVDAGFPGPAEKFLRIEATGDVGRKIRLLRARISLENGHPRQAEVDLLGLDGGDVNLLRARARSMLGEHGQAEELYRSAGLDDEAAREAWLARDWSGAASGAIPSPAAPVDTAPAQDTVVDNAVLARNRTLVEDAGQTRQRLQSMLDAAPVPSAGDG